MWFVYIIQAKDGKLYTGITTDIKRRLAEHSSGRGAKWTRSRGPFKLRHKEKMSARSGALKREAAIKRLDRKSKLRLIKRGISRKTTTYDVL